MSSEFTAEEATTVTVQSALDEFVTWLAGRGVEITHRWAGIFGFVPDLLPVAGRVTGDGLWVAGGYSGHGNVLGFLCGRLVARAILGDPDPLLDLFEPARLVAV
jgi:glycine/D-amino acid oxidase-like deaminating enzyme